MTERVIVCVQMTERETERENEADARTRIRYTNERTQTCTHIAHFCLFRFGVSYILEVKCHRYQNGSISSASDTNPIDCHTQIFLLTVRNVKKTYAHII